MELVDQYVLERLAREGRRYAAVMPDDAFGAPNPKMGPKLVNQKRVPYTGSYSMYYAARHASESKQGATRSQAVIEFAAVVIEVLGKSRRQRD